VFDPPELERLDPPRKDAHLIVDGAIGDLVPQTLAPEVQVAQPEQTHEDDREHARADVRPEPRLPAGGAFIDRHSRRGGRAVWREGRRAGGTRRRRGAVEHAPAEATLDRGILDLLGAERTGFHSAVLTPTRPADPTRAPSARARARACSVRTR